MSACCKDVCKLTTADGQEVACECVCKDSCEGSNCRCQCNPETAKQKADGTYFCECSCSPNSTCTKTCDGCVLTKTCRLVTAEGEEVECECTCNCTAKSSCQDCKCDCKCTPEIAVKGADGKYRCSCDCKC